MFGGSTDEYASLEARNRIKAEKEEKEAIKTLLNMVLSGSDEVIVGHRVSAILAKYPYLRKQRVINETVYCKWTGINHPTGHEGYYLGIGPETKCPVCGHKGKHHVHHDKMSWCRICTQEWNKNGRKPIN